MNKLDIPHVDSIVETVEKIKAGEINIIELVKEHIERAKKVNPELNAFITILEEEALGKANELQETLRQAQGDTKEKLQELKLLGIPFTAKDLYLVDGVRTTFGSKMMEDFIAPYTGTVIQKCLDEGAILIGKCNCDPWGFGGSGENSGFGPAKNPYDLERTPGGSSSGSAASMAAGIGFFSLGTDTGGSVRQPAGMTGLYGLKPTYGRNSRFGIGVMGSSFDTPGFFTRHIKDTVLLESIMEGRDEHDPTTFDLEEVRSQKSKVKSGQSSELNAELKTQNAKLRIGIPKEFFIDGLDPEIKSAIDKKIEDLKSKGFEVKEVSIPSTKYSLPVYYVLVPSEISSNRARYDAVRFGKFVSENYEENMVEARSKYFEPEVKRRIMIGTYALSSGYADQYYKKASKVRTKLKREFEKVFEEVNVLITPTSPTTAFKLGEKTEDPVQMYLADIFTVTANIVGVPSLNAPIGLDSNGLPIGMQIMGSWFEDENLFEIAKEIAN